jgi:hypothetical protein
VDRPYFQSILSPVIRPRNPRRSHGRALSSDRAVPSWTLRVSNVPRKNSRRVALPRCHFGTPALQIIGTDVIPYLLRFFLTPHRPRSVWHHLRSASTSPPLRPACTPARLHSTPPSKIPACTPPLLDYSPHPHRPHPGGDSRMRLHANSPSDGARRSIPDRSCTHSKDWATQVLRGSGDGSALWATAPGHDGRKCRMT